MIPQPQLETLKRLIKAAAPPPLIVAPMDARGSRFQLSTPRPGARIVGTAFTKADAELMAALWQWGALLIADLEHTVAVAKHYRAMCAGDGLGALPPEKEMRQAVDERIKDSRPDTIIKARAVGKSTDTPRRRHSPGRVASTLPGEK